MKRIAILLGLLFLSCETPTGIIEQDVSNNEIYIATGKLGKFGNGWSTIEIEAGKQISFTCYIGNLGPIDKNFWNVISTCGIQDIAEPKDLNSPKTITIQIQHGEAHNFRPFMVIVLSN